MVVQILSISLVLNFALTEVLVPQCGAPHSDWPGRLGDLISVHM